MRGCLALLAAVAASAAALAGCGDEEEKGKARPQTTAATPATTSGTGGEAKKTSTTPSRPDNVEAVVDGRTVAVRLSEISFKYCRSNAQVCAGIKTDQERFLTPNQRNAVINARQRLAGGRPQSDPRLTPGRTVPDPVEQAPPQSGYGY
jgi:hypothetical protein